MLTRPASRRYRETGCALRGTGLDICSAPAKCGPPRRPPSVGRLASWPLVLILIISLKYAILILRADNRGEGGIVALLALLGARHARPGTWRAGVLMLGLLGAASLYGDESHNFTGQRLRCFVSFSGCWP